MPNRYIIEGNIITREETVTTEVGKLSDLLPSLTQYMPLELSPLPHGLRYIANEPKQGRQQRMWLIVERPPGLTRINYKNVPASDSSPATSYRINLPWQFFWFILDASMMNHRTEEEVIWSPQQWGLFWSKEPYQDLNQEVTWAHMPNCWENGTICFGSTNVSAQQSIGNFVDAAINNFYTSEFNRDLDYQWPYRTMKRWEEAAAEDPESWTSWDIWTPQKMRPLLTFFENINEPNYVFRPTVPAVPGGEPIPEMPRYLTFDNLSEWSAGLTDIQRDRVKAVLNGDI